ncbi:MAG: putative metal-binding motif-containing protein [Myxococcales bacterium]|nr:putative metal-binding motif-containing protein [Myxococcales bacterium]
MKKGCLAAGAVFLLAGCQDPSRLESAILVKVSVDPSLGASCIEVRVENGGEVLATRRLLREGKNDFRVALFRGGMPAEVTASAQAMVGKGCEDPLAANGAASSERAAFEVGGVREVLLNLKRPPSDADGDGYVSQSAGGPDCDDAQATFHPAAEELCLSGYDRNCNGFVGCKDASCTGKPCIEPPSKLAFTSPPQTVAASACSAAVTVSVQDAAGQPSRTAGQLEVALFGSPAEGLELFSDASCGSTTTTVAIPADGESAALFFRGRRAGTVTLSAWAQGLSPASQAEVVLAGPAVSLAFATAPQAVAAGSCSQAVTVRLEDAFGNPVTAAAAFQISLVASPALGFSFFSDSGCTASTSQLPLAAGEGAATFFFRGTVAGSVAVTAGANGLAQASQTETVSPAPPVGLAFVTPVRSAAAGDCSGALTVEAQDSSGNPSPVQAATAVSLTGLPAGAAFYSDSGCANPVTQVTIGASGTRASFHFRGTFAGSFTVNAAAGVGSASQPGSIVPRPPSALGFATLPQTLAAGSCSATTTVELRDTYGNPSPLAVATPVSLSASAGSITFYSDASCSTVATGVIIPSGSPGASFFFQGSAAGAHTLTASATGFTGASQPATISAGTPSSISFSTATQTVSAGSCSSAVGLEVRDSSGNLSPVASPTSVSLTAAPSSGFGFFSDASCTSAASSLTIPAGASTATFYFRGTAAGSVGVTANAGTLGNPLQAETITAATASALVFTTPARTAAAGTCSAVLSLEVRDSYGNPSPVSAAAAISLAASPAAGFGLYSDASCSNPASSLALAVGASTASFYFRGTAAGSVNLTASASGLSPATQGQTVGPAAAAKLAFATPSRTAVAGGCSAVLTVRSEDTYGNLAPVSAAQSPSLTAVPSAGFGFFSDSTCSTSVTSVTIAVGASSASFYFRGTAAGSIAVTATSSTLGTAAQPEQVDPAAASQLVFASPAQTVDAGACSLLALLEARDSYGNPSPVGSVTAATLSSNGSAGFGFFSDAGCSSAATAATIAAGQSSAGFYFRGTVAEAVTVTATSSLGAPTQGETVRPAAASKLVITTPAQSLAVGVCSAQVTVRSQDAYGNLSNVSASTAVALAANPPAGFTFYSNATCTTPVTQVNIASGSSSAGFYFASTASGSITVSVSAALMSGDSQLETLTAGSATSLVFITGAETLAAGDCSKGATVELRDSLGNPSPVAVGTPVALAAAPSANFTFYSDSGCTVAVSSVNIPSSTARATFYFAGTLAGTVTVTATALGLSANQAETITAGPAVKLGFITAARTPAAGDCSLAVTVESQDVYGNRSSTSGNKTLTLSPSPATGFTFFSDPACGTSVTSLPWANGSSQATFYFSGTVAQPVTVTATLSGLGSANQQETVLPAPGSQLAFASPAYTAVAGACAGPLTIDARDTYGNSSPLPAATPVSLAALPAAGFTFYLDAGCTTSATSVTIAAGSSSANFYFAGTQAGAVDVTASEATLGSVTQQQTVTPGSPSRLAFTSGAQAVPAGGCSALVGIRSEDNLGNPSPVGAATTVSLTSSAASGFVFFSDPGCTASIGSVTIPLGGTAASFYFKGTVAEPVTVTASAGGLTPASQLESISALAPTVLVFTTPPQSVVAGDCSAVMTVQTRDIYGNVSPVGPATPVGLAASASNFEFFTTTCTGATVNSVTIAAGASSTDFYFRGTAAGPSTVTASAGGFTNGSQGETITPASPDHLEFATSPQALTAGSCSALTTVRAVDIYGNPSPLGASSTVTLTASNAATAFYADSGCTLLIGSVTINAGSSSASFYFRGTQSGPVTLTASAPGLAPDATQGQTITPAQPATLSFTTAPQTVQAGKCSLVVTVESRDAFGNLTDTAMTVGLAASPGTGFIFYQENSCTTPIASVGIPAGQSSASFYYAGITGGSQSISASSAPATDAVQTADIVPAVRTGTCMMAGGTNSVTCAIAPALFDTSKTILIFQAINTDNSGSGANLRCALTGTTTFNCYRNSNGLLTLIRWNTVEFGSGVTVQHITPASCTSSGTPPRQTVTVSAVNPSSTFILASSERAAANNSGPSFRTISLLNGTTVEITFSNTGCVASDRTSLQVVDFAGASVTRGTTGSMTGTSLPVGPLSPATLGRTFLLYSYRTGATGADMCERALRGRMANGTSIDFTRGDGAGGCAGEAIDAIHYERVTLPLGNSVQQLDLAMAALTPSVSTTITAVDLTRTAAFAGGQWAGGQATGEGSYSADDIIGEMRAGHSLPTSTSLQLDRGSTIGSARFTSYVVQFDP